MREENSAILPVAGFWIRFAAYAIEYLILSTIYGFIMGVCLGLAYLLSIINGGNQLYYINGGMLLYFGISLTSGLTYYVLMESSKFQGTLSKIILGLVVTDMHGKRISTMQAFIRCFSMIISIPTFGISYLVALFTKNKQTLHDIIGKTVVLEKKYLKSNS